MKSIMHAPDRASIDICRYGYSNVRFRGPIKATDQRYIAFLGGSETFGTSDHLPYPEILEARHGGTCINLSSRKTGPDLYLRDPGLRQLIQGASAVVIQIMGAANLSNRYYRVHPRRNDRFTAPNDALKRLYPEVDFTEFAFTGHLLSRLMVVDPDRALRVKTALQQTWLRRMATLIGLASGSVHLLWLSRKRSDDQEGELVDPAFVTRAMLLHLEPKVASLSQIVIADTPVLDCPTELDPAHIAPGYHQNVADDLGPLLRPAILQ